MVDVIALVSTVLIIMTWTSLYKANKLSTFTEKLFVAVASVHIFLTGILFLYGKIVERIFAGDYLIFVPLILGVTILLRIIPKYAWLSRYGIALLLGNVLGIAVRGAPGLLFEYVQAGVVPITNLNGVVILVGTVTLMWYFFFTIKPTSFGGVSKYIARLGLWFAMATMGMMAATQGYTRFTFAVERIAYIMETLGLL